MKSQIRFPRLTRRDAERILDVHQQLNRARDVLEHANWPGAKATSSLLMSALILLSELYNRSEQAFLAGVQTRGAAGFENGQADLPAPPAAADALEVTTVVNKQG